MKIGVVTEYYYPSVGGIQEHVHHFAREARRLGHTVRIVTSAMPDLGAEPGAPQPDVIRLGRSLPAYTNGGFGRVTGGLGVRGALREVLARERFDVVHVHAPLTPVLPLLAIHHATGPLVGTFHTNFRPGLLFRMMRGPLQRYLDRLDAAVAVSQACLGAFRDRLHADFRIIPNGVDAERFARGRRLRRYDDGKLNVLFVGRLEPRNGLDRLLAAFHRAWRQVGARLLVLGDGPLLPRYRAMVPRELREDVVFAGRVLDERPDWYATADVYCAPTRLASFGVTLLEAMASGKPVLAADIDGFREVMQHGREGELLSGDDPAAWARALVRIAREPARAQAYGERGRLTTQRYAWPSVTREVLGLYRSIGVRG
ncbi:glycosyltransferase family 4 protein [Anaeromyxobacter dehalogenans]|uniref:Phosphatidylinositol alpha-mannosyltransferase n=1 Tax=Anaeromyxobacter dehalogenans (strain 2CP-C) TaxID=290397 RepID=Q2IKK6_ANADE|nr:glycosyltransferase family 4 protein [Anaeromyxobacter dehalogenans]ABC82188.1 Phosphatidylinositol alpha-mannosyltransferase [Anaeromyxobacter dehalogenans 2CP-C]